VASIMARRTQTGATPASSGSQRRATCGPRRCSRAAAPVGILLMARILVTEEIAEGGLDRLRAAGHTVDVRTGLSPAELRDEIGSAAALIIRSATTVDRELLEAAGRLEVIGRAGIGLDNVDVEA